MDIVESIIGTTSSPMEAFVKIPEVLDTIAGMMGPSCYCCIKSGISSDGYKNIQKMFIEVVDLFNKKPVIAHVLSNRAIAFYEKCVNDMEKVE